MSDLWTKAGYKIAQNHEQLEINKKTVEEFTKQIQGLEDKLQFTLPARKKTLEDEAGPAGAEDQIKALRALADATKTTADARSSYEENYWKQLHALGQISDAQELTDLYGVLDKKLAAIKDYYAQQREIARKEAAATGEPAAPKLTQIGAEETSATSGLQKEKDTLGAEYLARQKQQDNDLATAAIDATQRKVEAQIKLEEQAATELYALHGSTAAQETATLQELETRSFNTTRDALEKKHALQREEPKYTQASLAQQEQMEKTWAIEVETLETEHQARMAEIKARGAEEQMKLDEKAAIHAEETAVRSANEQLHTAEQLYNKKLETHQISIFTWERDEIAAINRWEAKQIAAYEEVLAKLRAMGLEHEQIYQDVLDKEKVATQKAADEREKIEETTFKKVEQVWNQFTNLINQNLNKMLTEHQSFVKTVENIWNGMAMMLIQYMEKLVEQ